MFGAVARYRSRTEQRSERLVARHRSLRSELYRDARLMGNAQAASHGPLAYGKRYARRKVYARTNSFTRSILRAISLSK